MCETAPGGAQWVARFNSRGRQIRLIFGTVRWAVETLDKTSVAILTVYRLQRWQD
jgi:hypothetical protein